MRLTSPVRRAAALLVPGLALLLTSCGGADKAPTFPVKGQVRDVNGKPLLGVQVIFHPTVPIEECPKPTAVTAELGRFELSTYAKGDGAPAGDYAITLVWPTPKDTPREAVSADRFDGRYADTKFAKFFYRVEPRDMNEVPMLRLPFAMD